MHALCAVLVLYALAMSTRKKSVRRFPLLKKVDLVGELNLLLSEVSNPLVVLTEEDLTNPTVMKNTG